MPDALPQRAPHRPHRRSDHSVVARVDPHQQPDPALLAEALLLHAAEQRAKAQGDPLPHLAGTHKLTARRSSISSSEEGDDE